MNFSTVPPWRSIVARSRLETPLVTPATPRDPRPRRLASNRSDHNTTPSHLAPAAAAASVRLARRARPPSAGARPSRSGAFGRCHRLGTIAGACLTPRSASSWRRIDGFKSCSSGPGRRPTRSSVGARVSVDGQRLGVAPTAIQREHQQPPRISVTGSTRTKPVSLESPRLCSPHASRASTRHSIAGRVAQRASWPRGGQLELARSASGAPRHSPSIWSRSSRAPARSSPARTAPHQAAVQSAARRTRSGSTSSGTETPNSHGHLVAAGTQ